MSTMLILPGVQDHEYPQRQALDPWPCANAGEAIRAINEDDRCEIRAVYGLGADVGRVIDALDNITKACIRLIVVKGNPKDDPAWTFNGPWELVYRP